MMERDEFYWEEKTRVFLHDPPDKPLDIKGHEDRAKAALKGLGLWLVPEEKRLPDAAAAAMARAPVPYLMGEGAVRVDVDEAYFIHPISGAVRKFDKPDPFDPVGRRSRLTWRPLPSV
ncbi:MAG: hypothetical protein Kow0069_37670 [Promethearchaeota archaeon]